MLDQNELLATTREKMHQAVQVIQKDLATIRTGRATPSLVGDITISAYDGTTEMKLTEMATITTSNGRTLVVSPFDPSQIKAIEKGILASDVDLTPVVDGQVIRLSVPPLTQERREEFIKLAKAKIEGGRVMVRQIRRDALSQLKRAFEMQEFNEDEKKLLEDKIQDIVDATMAEIELIWRRKEQELRRV